MDNPQTTTETDLAVIGAGPGGYAAAFLAADRGFRTTLIDSAEQPGGVCLNCGCIPSKTLLHIAKLIGEAREAVEHGVRLRFDGVDLDKLRAWKDEVIARNAGGLRQLAKARKVSIVRAVARFADARTLRLGEIGTTNTQQIRFKYAVIATGSRPAAIPGLPTDGPRVMDSTAALALPEVPGSMLVIGGGYIGLEIGTIYAALGSRVTVVEMTADLLPGADRDLVRILQIRLKKTFECILLKSRVVSLADTGRGVAVTIVDEGGKTAEQTFDRVLVAVGRTPNSRDLGLETLGLSPDVQGLIPVDDHRRTSVGDLYAIGDVVGGPMLAHKASHDARVAVASIAGQPTLSDSGVIPSIVFSDPEIAWAGLTEADAAVRNIAVEVAKFPWAASGRAASISRTDGLTKILVSPDDKRILGLGIVGAGAGELLAEGVLAINSKATAHDVAHSIHAHPTLSETVGEAAEAALGSTPHIFRPQR